MNEVLESLDGLSLGAPQVHGNLSLFPLLGVEDRAPGYVLLDDALERKLASITEVSGAGSVPELAFENNSADPVLLVDGDELVGAKQNRVLNLSILVGGGNRIVIPVSCVEHGRWSYRSHEFATAKRALFARARAKKMAQVSVSLSHGGTRRSDQGEIWSDIADKVRFSRADSATGAMGDAYAATEDRLQAYVNAFRAEPLQRGAVLAIDGDVVGLEVFDAAATFARYLEKLVRSYALDAIETVGKGGHTVADEQAARRFIESLKSAGSERFAALGEGEDIRLSGRGIAGGALAKGGHVVHLAGFAVRS